MLLRKSLAAGYGNIHNIYIHGSETFKCVILISNAVCNFKKKDHLVGTEN